MTFLLTVFARPENAVQRPLIRADDDLPESSTVSASTTVKPLAGWRVLVPRGGTWGEVVAASLREKGAVPVVAPLVNFAPAGDQDALDAVLARLSAGEFDWVTITSIPTVDVLFAHQSKIPDGTRIAAVGETTATALESAGFRVSLVASQDNSAEGLARQIIALESQPRRILTLRGENARPVLAESLVRAGHHVDSVAVYRTVGLPVADRVRRDVESGRINAILVTGPAVATQVYGQFHKIPLATLLARVGAHDARDATARFGRVDAAEDRAIEALIDTVSGFALPHAADEFPP